jgi:D-xylose transport system substrate-binding protein
MRKPSTMPSMFVILLVFSLLLGGCNPVVAPGAAAPSDAEVTAEAIAEATAVQPEADGAAAACTPGEGLIAVLLPDTVSSPRWEQDDRRFFDEALTAAGVEYRIENAQGDPVTQRSQAQKALVEGAKVLILTNLNNESGASIIADARAAGARVIDYDRLTAQGPGADLYVSFDNYGVGSLMGQTLEPKINALGLDAPQIVQLNGSTDDNNATMVRAGYSAVATTLYNEGKWQLVADVPVPDWDPQQAQEIFAQVLAEAGEEGVNAVFAGNDALAGAIVQVLKTQGKQPVLLSGQDATVEGLQNILAGWQTMTVYKSIQGEVGVAVEAAVKMLNCTDPNTLVTNSVINNGERDIPFIMLDPVAVTADNIAGTVIADGFRTWDEICVDEYQQYCPPEGER